MPLATGNTGTEDQAEVQSTTLTTRTQRLTAGQLRGSIDLQQKARGTGMKRISVHQRTTAGGQDTEATVEEMIVDAGQAQGGAKLMESEGEVQQPWSRIELPLALSGIRMEAQAETLTKDLPTRDQLASAGQQQGRINMQQAEGESDTKRRRVQQPIASGGHC